MDYHKIYNQLILKRQQLIPDGYTEKHHIIPRCLNGTDDGINLVKLTAREHFIAHKLLVKIYIHTSLVYAANMMCNFKRYNSKNYSWLKEKHQSILIGRILSETTKEKLRVKALLRTHTDETKEKISSHPYKQTQQFRDNVSIACKGKIRTEEQRKNYSNANRNRPPEHYKNISTKLKGRIVSSETKSKQKSNNIKLASIKYECPHCLKLVDIGNFNRWHGDNCKHYSFSSSANS